jgi:hypothetical protein
MIELFSSAGSSGPSAAIALRERAQTHTVLATSSTNAAGSITVKIQVADSTQGTFLDVLNMPSVGGGAGEARTVPAGVYVAMRAYLVDSPSPGTVTVKLYSD